MTRRDPLWRIGDLGAPLRFGDLSPATLTLRQAEAPIELPEGVTLDAAAAVLARGGRSVPGRPTSLGMRLPVGTLVWARHSGRWRQGVVDGEAGRTSHPAAPTGGKIATVPVIYTPDRTGRLDRHRWPVAELRLREMTP